MGSNEPMRNESEVIMKCLIHRTADVKSSKL